jgi:hypothetical protein
MTEQKELQVNKQKLFFIHKQPDTYRKGVSIYLVSDGFRCRLPTAVIKLVNAKKK